LHDFILCCVDMLMAGQQQQQQQHVLEQQRQLGQVWEKPPTHYSYNWGIGTALPAQTITINVSLFVSCPLPDHLCGNSMRPAY